MHPVSVVSRFVPSAVFQLREIRFVLARKLGGISVGVVDGVRCWQRGCAKRSTDF